MRRDDRGSRPEQGPETFKCAQEKENWAVRRGSAPSISGVGYIHAFLAKLIEE
jgi:hypothetical protein